MKVSSRKSSFIVYSVIIKVIKMIHMNLCIWIKKNNYSYTAFISIAIVKFVLAKYYKDSEMTAYISERSRNSK